MEDSEWEDVRKGRFSSIRPKEWPEGVYSISRGGLSLLGVHEKDHKLFWDGQEIVTKRVVRLRWYELILATMAAIGTFGVFGLEVARSAGWLPG